ncbi:hypothetical protein [Luteibacter sp.]|uniref:hypothetical protein n=1 Tax=Luteibacter sp. TaxID=1886636 RepID=UPI002808A1F4|nr:hypothetical protein [Luteibacter sp.]MDQ8051072.1 hypothetical protein [Luteibacter sp.]
MTRFTPLEQRKVAVGVDLGQSKDPTSLAVVERIRQVVPDYLVEQLQQRGQRGREQLAEMKSELAPERFNLRLLEQAPLGEPYPVQAQRVNRILARESIAVHEPRVFVDYTGVGRAVFDIFRAERVPRIVPITITFQGGSGNSVPKLDLVSRLQALMHTGALHMPDTLPLAKIFRRELLDFRVSYTPVGNATFGAREGAHDDLILAVALAVYGLTRPEMMVEPLRFG